MLSPDDVDIVAALIVLRTDGDALQRRSEGGFGTLFGRRYCGAGVAQNAYAEYARQVRTCI